jgi:hypothetical protein
MLNLLAAVCVVVFATDRPNWDEIYRHEIAHCNGWEHPVAGPPRKGENYQAPKPPLRYLHMPDMPVITRAVKTEEALKLCDRHWGCQWFVGE